MNESDILGRVNNMLARLELIRTRGIWPHEGEPMSTKPLGERSHLTVVNADPASVATGAAVMSLIVAEATRRPHLAEAIASIQYDTERGVGVLMTDAGTRQHLANALGFDGQTEDYRLPRIGTGIARRGRMAGLRVIIWNIEP